MSNEAKVQTRVENIDKLVSKKLKMRRMFLGLSQQELANVVSVSIQQMQKYEQGINRISSGKLYTLAKYLKVPVNYFFDQSNITMKEIDSVEKSSIADVNIDQISEKEISNFIKAFVAIEDPKTRGKFLELLKIITYYTKS